MKRLLTLRHWQLFSISWGLLTAFFACLIFQPDFLLYYLQGWILIFLIGTVNSFVWVWITAKMLNQLNADNLRTDSKVFNIFFWIPTTYVACIVFYLLFNLFIYKIKSFNIELELTLWAGFGILSALCILLGFFFIARTLKTAEVQRTLKIHEYLPELALLLFPPIGVWNIQPRLNRLINENTTSSLKCSAGSLQTSNEPKCLRHDLD